MRTVSTERRNRSPAEVAGHATTGTERPMNLSLINHLLQSYGYYAVFAFIALESLGIPLPGETTLAAAAILGDNAGYWIGRSGGLRLVSRYGRFVRLDAAKMKIGRYLFARHGGK